MIYHHHIFNIYDTEIINKLFIKQSIISYYLFNLCNIPQSLTEADKYIKDINNYMIANQILISPFTRHDYLTNKQIDIINISYNILKERVCTVNITNRLDFLFISYTHSNKYNIYFINFFSNFRISN